MPRIPTIAAEEVSGYLDSTISPALLSPWPPCRPRVDRQSRAVASSFFLKGVANALQNAFKGSGIGKAAQSVVDGNSRKEPKTILDVMQYRRDLRAVKQAMYGLEPRPGLPQGLAPQEADIYYAVHPRDCDLARLFGEHARAAQRSAVIALRLAAADAAAAANAASRANERALANLRSYPEFPVPPLTPVTGKPWRLPPHKGEVPTLEELDQWFKDNPPPKAVDFLPGKAPVDHDEAEPLPVPFLGFPDMHKAASSLDLGAKAREYLTTFTGEPTVSFHSIGHRARGSPQEKAELMKQQQENAAGKAPSAGQAADANNQATTGEEAGEVAGDGAGEDRDFDEAV